jgi:YVTN family beta-propeller protein
MRLLRLCRQLAGAGFVACFLASAQTLAQNAYITNFSDNTVSVIATATNTVTTTIPVGTVPLGVAVSPDGSTVYVANELDGVSVIDTATNTVTATVPAGFTPFRLAVTPDGSKVYVTDAGAGANTVSVIDTATNTMTATIPVGPRPEGVAVTPVQRKREAERERGSGGGREREPDRSKVYVANNGANTLSVIDTATNTVIATITVGSNPLGVAVTPVQREREAERERGSGGGREREPDRSKVYVTNQGDNTVSVIDTATNTVTATIPVGSGPSGVAVTPDGTKVYVANAFFGFGTNVSVIDAATNTVIATIPAGSAPGNVAVTPDGRRVYVTNFQSNNVSVIDTATNTVTATIPVGGQPGGVAIQPAPRFAGTPGKANCYGKSVSALVRKYKGLNAAAAALGFPSVRALQNAILEFCEGDE